MSDATYDKGGRGEQKISVVVEQIGSTVNLSVQAAAGGQGKGSGTLSTTVGSIKLQSTAPDCPGSYEGSLKFTGDTLSWSYKGQDCGGPMQGRGTAKRMKSNEQAAVNISGNWKIDSQNGPSPLCGFIQNGDNFIGSCTGPTAVGNLAVLTCLTWPSPFVVGSCRVTLLYQRHSFPPPLPHGRRRRTDLPCDSLGRAELDTARAPAASP